MDAEQFYRIFHEVEDEVGRVIIGQKEIIRQSLICLLAGGNLLLEGVPGLGKTLLVKTIASTLALRFSRIQFTPDLMPADIIGTNIIMQNESGNKYFEFQPGPVFANIILADEINRATPKTQSALLEAMQEKTVTAAGETRPLPQPFFVLATQNPLEMEGTYPLPEAQMDRFLFKLVVKFPDEEHLSQIFALTTGKEEYQVREIAEADTIEALKQYAKGVLVADKVTNAVSRLIVASHPTSSTAPDKVKKYVRYGASPRGGQALIAAGKVRALIDKRYNVSLEDIKELAYPALRHRILLNFEGESEGIIPDELIAELLDKLLD
ncbi:MAG: MoxR family ATPase [Syntrophomonadaceae bacterium]|nr:MoxR family ATPase [Syntrophomonadaceae bacterium]